MNILMLIGISYLTFLVFFTEDNVNSCTYDFCIYSLKSNVFVPRRAPTSSHPPGSPLSLSGHHNSPPPPHPSHVTDLQMSTATSDSSSASTAHTPPAMSGVRPVWCHSSPPAGGPRVVGSGGGRTVGGSGGMVGVCRSAEAEYRPSCFEVKAFTETE